MPACKIICSATAVAVRAPLPPVIPPAGIIPEGAKGGGQHVEGKTSPLPLLMLEKRRGREGGTGDEDIGIDAGGNRRGGCWRCARSPVSFFLVPILV